VELSTTSPVTVSFRGYVIGNGSVSVNLRQGINVIGVPVMMNAFSYIKDVMEYFCNKSGSKKMVCYMARKNTASLQYKKLLGYTYIEGDEHRGILLDQASLSEKLGGDAIAVVAPKDMSVIIAGVAWSD
jgi:hypothetical protein